MSVLLLMLGTMVAAAAVVGGLDALVNWWIDRPERASSDCPRLLSTDVATHRANRQLDVRVEQFAANARANRAIAELAREIAVLRELERRGRP